MSTMRPFWQARTKHRPRWPSRSLHKRGQRSHCVRPSERRRQYLVGTVPIDPVALMSVSDSPSRWFASAIMLALQERSVRLTVRRPAEALYEMHDESCNATTLAMTAADQVSTPNSLTRIWNLSGSAKDPSYLLSRRLNSAQEVSALGSFGPGLPVAVIAPLSTSPRSLRRKARKYSRRLASSVPISPSNFAVR